MPGAFFVRSRVAAVGLFGGWLVVGPAGCERSFAPTQPPEPVAAPPQPAGHQLRYAHRAVALIGHAEVEIRYRGSVSGRLVAKYKARIDVQPQGEGRLKVRNEIVEVESLDIEGEQIAAGKAAAEHQKEMVGATALLVTGLDGKTAEPATAHLLASDEGQGLLDGFGLAGMLRFPGLPEAALMPGGEKTFSRDKPFEHQGIQVPVHSEFVYRLEAVDDTTQVAQLVIEGEGQGHGDVQAQGQTLTVAVAEQRSERVHFDLARQLPLSAEAQMGRELNFQAGEVRQRLELLVGLKVRYEAAGPKEASP